MTQTQIPVEKEASVSKADKPTKEPKGKKKSNPGRQELPVLIELALNFSYLFLFLITAVMAAISYQAGANFLQILLRSGIASAVFGILLTALTGQIADGALEAAIAEVEGTEAMPEAKPSEGITYGAAEAASQEIQA
jgi:hypothetical protein